MTDPIQQIADRIARRASSREYAESQIAYEIAAALREQREAGRQDAQVVAALRDAVQTAHNYYALFHDDVWQERLTRWESALTAEAGQAEAQQEPERMTGTIPIAAVQVADRTAERNDDLADARQEQSALDRVVLDDRMRQLVEAKRQCNALSYDKSELLADLAEAQQQIAAQWQPIATAPKDGRWILGFVPTWTFGIALFYWEPSDEIWDIHYRTCHASKFAQPTHWMPLPASPERTHNK